MADSLNADVAQELTERHGGDRHKERWERLAEVIEVAVLVVVATTTAWSGYQAAKWSGREASLYQEATQYRFRAEAAATLGGLEITSDSALFTAWLQAETNGDAVFATQAGASVHSRLPGGLRTMAAGRNRYRSRT